ncbi:hypothetical protein NQ318_012898 [Aromia moschata]|uniref:Uncharacterized protein n=1 Tax=Aromia moschata TaxID=1265417 RepID=A0AAV8YCY5_9CUCU|nr:hypothetical protein NQ318_012898 [Aromia moschata]
MEDFYQGKLQARLLITQLPHFINKRNPGQWRHRNSCNNRKEKTKTKTHLTNTNNSTVESTGTPMESLQRRLRRLAAQSKTTGARGTRNTSYKQCDYFFKHLKS